MELVGDVLAGINFEDCPAVLNKGHIRMNLLSMQRLKAIDNPGLFA